MLCATPSANGLVGNPVGGSALRLHARARSQSHLASEMVFLSALGSQADGEPSGHSRQGCCESAQHE